MRSLAPIGVGLLALIGAAYAAGYLLRDTACSQFVGLATLLALGLGVGAVFRPAQRVVGALLVAWLGATVLVEPFACAVDTFGGCIGVVWLVPLAAGAVILPGRGDWLAGAGTWAALFAGIAALTYTATHAYSGIGLIEMWRD